MSKNTSENLPCVLLEFKNNSSVFLKGIDLRNDKTAFTRASTKNGGEDWYTIYFIDTKAVYNVKAELIASMTDFPNEKEYKKYLELNYGEPKEESSSDTK